MNNKHEKIVDFSLCSQCYYYDRSMKDGDPCHDCLENPVNTESVKPVYFKKVGSTNGKKPLPPQRKD